MGSIRVNSFGWQFIGNAMDTSIAMVKSVVLSVGQDFYLRRGKDHIVYAGMVSDRVYFIAQKKSNGYQGYAWNLYFPGRRRDITIDEVSIFIEIVTRRRSN